MTTEQRQALVEKAAKLMYQLESGIDAETCEKNWPLETSGYRRFYVGCADTVVDLVLKEVPR